MNDELHVAYFDAASESMQKPEEEELKKSEQFHCLNVSISQFQCLFSLNKKELSTEEFNIWIKIHECSSKHNKSSGSIKLMGQLKSSAGLSLNTILSSERV